jgi:glucosamine kinase
MNLVIDSGGTKSNLAFLENGKIIDIFTEPGLQLSRETVQDFEKKVIRWSEFKQGRIDSVFLFAAGHVTKSKEQELIEILHKAFGANQVELHSDLLAACFATAGSNKGIVGILGTGSNSCYYDGETIIKNIPPGGFVLGDEGSGANLGRQFLADYLRKKMPEEIQKQLENELNLSADMVIENIYGGSVRDAAWFCSGFAPFIVSKLNHEYCYKLCTHSIKDYVDLIEKNYISHSNKLYLVGSIAYYLKDLIILEAKKRNIEIIKIIQHPINDLAVFLSGKYHL